MPVKVLVDGHEAVLGPRAKKMIAYITCHATEILKTRAGCVTLHFGAGPEDVSFTLEVRETATWAEIVHRIRETEQMR